MEPVAPGRWRTSDISLGEVATVPTQGSQKDNKSKIGVTHDAKIMGTASKCTRTGQAESLTQQRGFAASTRDLADTQPAPVLLAYITVNDYPN